MYSFLVILVFLVSSEQLIKKLNKVLDFIEEALQIASKIEEIDDEEINKVIEQINSAIRKLDRIGDLVVGLAEIEEEEGIE